VSILICVHPCSSVFIRGQEGFAFDAD